MLSKLMISNIGPFYKTHTIEFERDVTVLTGANDVGKSKIIDLLAHYINNSAFFTTQDSINNNWILESEVPWKKDKEINLKIFFTNNSDKTLFPTFSELEFNSFPIPETNPRLFSFQIENNIRKKINVDFNHVNNLSILYNEDELIPSFINIQSNSNPTKRLLDFAFGSNFNERFLILKKHTQQKLLEKGSAKINSSIQSLFGDKKYNIEFFYNESEKNLELILVDQYSGEFPFSYRGNGIKKMLSILVLLSMVEIENPNKNILLLLDEPENSLHADSQHMLRIFLENLAENERVQVVYATHSPAMINPLRPQSIRLLQRYNNNGTPTTTIKKSPYEDGFYAVRQELGVNPADSLLYSPFIILVEGQSEFRGLPILLERLMIENHQNLQSKLEDLIPLITIMDGHGDSLKKYIPIIQAQTCKPFILLDGDKQQLRSDIEKTYSTVPVLILEEGQEFEDLFNQDDYFTVLRDYFDNENILREHFQNWCNSDKAPGFINRKMFSKQVELWLENTIEKIKFDKADIAELLAKSVNLESINLDKIIELINLIE